MRSICLYCGSRVGFDPRFRRAAEALGTIIGRNGDTLIYGGGRVGLMGVAADAALAAGGRVVGVIPEHIQAREVGHNGLTELHVVDSMHTRKRMMFDRADAVVVLPGGLGTLDETIEMITWRQLSLHDKPIILVDEGGFWAPLLALIEHVIGHGFSLPEYRGFFAAVQRVEDVYDALDRAPASTLPPRASRL